MRYFTRHWYDRIQASFFSDVPFTEEESSAPFREYRAHLANIGHLLPSNLLFVAAHLSLHDGLFKGVAHHQAARQLDIRLRCGDLPSGYFDLELSYHEATILTEPTVGLNGLVNNAEYEILYDEVDVADGGVYEHRMLLWPDGEVALRFSSFMYEQIAVADRDAP